MRAWGAWLLVLCMPCAVAAQEVDAAADAAPEADAEGETDAPERPEDPAMADARVRLARGQALYDAGDYEGALAEFTRLYERLEGHPARPLATYNLARCHERLFAYDEAIALYERYLDEAGPEGQYLEAVRGKLEALNDLLGTVSVSVRFEGAPAAWVLREGERELGQRERLRLPAGTHRLEVSAEGYELATTTVTFAAGDVREVELTLRERFEGLSPDAFVVSVGISAVLAITAAVLGAVALAEHDAIVACQPDPACRAERLPDADADEARLYGLAIGADISWGLAGAAAITAIVLATLTRFDTTPDDAVRLRGAGLEVVW